MFICQIDTIIL